MKKEKSGTKSGLKAYFAIFMQKNCIHTQSVEQTQNAKTKHS